MRVPLLPLFLAAAALALASVLNLELADRLVSRPYDVVHVPSGHAMRAVALGHRTLVSDLYWLSAVQYIGEPTADERGWENLFPLVDLVTDLDPRHGYAYQTAGIVLSAAGRIDESNRILQKGIDKGPPYWSFPYYLSFNYWFYRGNYEKGAEYARLAARQPGASTNIAQLALSLSSKSGTPEDAVSMLQELRRSVQDEVTAAALDHQLKLAILERNAQALDAAAARFRTEQGRPIHLVDELVWNGYIQRLPPDPFGGRWVWDAEGGKIRSSANPFRFSVRDFVPRTGFQWKPRQEELRRMPQ